MGNAKKQGPSFRINMDATAPGIRREAYGTSVMWEGRRDAIIRAGIALPEWFCDGTERDKYGRTKRTKRVEVDGRKVDTQQQGTGELFRVRISCTDAETAEYERKRKERDRQERLAASTGNALADEALRAVLSVESGTCLPVGSICLYWSPGAPWHATQVEVTGEFRLRGVWYDERMMTRPGYLAKFGNGKEFFVPAHELRTTEVRKHYLSLAADGGKRLKTGSQ